jgi:hypothetical protein
MSGQGPQMKSKKSEEAMKNGEASSPKSRSGLREKPGQNQLFPVNIMIFMAGASTSVSVAAPISSVLKQSLNQGPDGRVFMHRSVTITCSPGSTGVSG